MKGSKNIKRRPKIVKNAHLEYLDALRQSGVTNMYGASPYLELDFGLTRDESHVVLQFWMDTFEERHPV